jgi:hypothetical protein
MSFRSTVTVEFGDKSGLNDISARVQGAQVMARLRVGDFGTNRTVITLRNDDGAFTPGAGGTYDGVDWFSQGLFIAGDTGNYTYDLFHGLITSFDLNDDGVNSTVTIEADDALTVGGSSSTTFNVTFAFGGNLVQWIEYAYNGVGTGGSLVSGVPMPLLANTTSSVDVTGIGVMQILPDPNGAGTDDYIAVQPARDFVRTVLMPSALNVGWPTTIDLSSTDTKFNALSSNLFPVRGSSTAITFTFDESPAAGELPFNNLKRGFAIDDLINTAVIGTIPLATTGLPSSETATNAGSIDKYGARTIQMNSVMVGAKLLAPSVVATRWANVFSEAEFQVRTFNVNESLVSAQIGSSTASEEKWAQLLDVASGPMQVGVMNFTASGASSQSTEAFVVMSRTISITPDDIRLRVECLPIDQTGAFVLDSSTLGVLDTNRLG